MTDQIIRLKVGLDAQDLFSSFAYLTEERLRCCLLGRHPDEIPNAQIIAIGAFRNQQPIGLALASLYPSIHYVDVLSLFVLEEYRKQHVGFHLFKNMQQEAIEEGGRYFSCLYKSEDLASPAFEKILLRLGWQGKNPFMIRCIYDVPLFNPPWVHLKISLPSSVEEFVWRDLTAEDRIELQKQIKQHLFPAVFSPFHSADLIEPLNSLGLRYQGKIIGWCLTHRIAPDTIRYSSLFIQRNFRYGKLAMKLLIDSMQLHMKTPTPWAVFEVPLLYVEPSWVHLVEKHLVPYACKVIRIIQAWKI